MSLPAASSADVVAVCPLLALERDGARWVQDGVALVRQGGRVLAFEDTCPHAGASLADAEIRHGAVSCPRHHARFRLRDGKSLVGPARRPLRCFDVEVSGDALLVRPRTAPTAAPGLRDRLRHLLGHLVQHLSGTRQRGGPAPL